MENWIKKWVKLDESYWGLISAFFYGFLTTALFNAAKLFILKSFFDQHLFDLPFEFMAFSGVFAVIFFIKRHQSEKKQHIDEEASWLLRFDQLTDKLYAYERSFQQIIDHTPVGVLMFALNKDDQLIFTGANPSADKILGYDLSRHLGKTIEKAFPGVTDKNNFLLQEYLKVVKGHTPSYYADESFYEDEQTTGIFEICAFSTGSAQMAVFFTRQRKKRIGDILVEKGVERTLVEAAAKIVVAGNDCYCTLVPEFTAKTKQ